MNVPSYLAPYILHALPGQTVFDLLSHGHNKPCHSILIMDQFLAGEDQPASGCC